ncbi:hypothetical protein M2M59_07360 [Rummeliibacillus sp. G93]|uniref:hypothetical protein n=1 Tax=Rummeliibacillus sp. G93 TaxID=2939494 RepID=UPI00201BF256|nr:hypothetical protein [Rummeliibacillus sp. G93]UQW98823.1 hypothetical protein M2M59_07360 [Rummeliibacillus sp. G93]
MSRKPIGTIKEAFKKYGPKAGKFIKDNRKEIFATVGTFGAGGESIKKYREKKKESNKAEGKLHYRKERYNLYKTKILTELDSQNRNELFQYILEIEQFIQQIKNEEKKESGVKKPIHEKRIKNWNDILIQIKDKMSTKDYLEFIKIYNNPNYKSEYFKGFEGHVEKFKKLNNVKKTDDLLKYIAEITNRTIDQIEKDFSLID